MENLEYSVIIRTMGTAHEKYERLLESINKLSPAPVEIIVVLPIGYSIPNERLGNERFCYSPKGMVSQRMAGVKQCKTKYALICDDDVCFPPNFIQKLYEPLRLGKGEFSAGPLFSFLPPKGLKAFVCAIMGDSFPTLLHRNRYISISHSGGYLYNRNLKHNTFYESQSAAWTCFFADIDALLKIDLEDEKWLDINGYSYLDDQTMFFKAWLRGLKTIIVPDAIYEHLDGKTSIVNNRPAVLYSKNFNKVVFWHRFIYLKQNTRLLKVWSMCCFQYRTIWIFVYGLINVIRRRLSCDDYKIYIDGIYKGMSYIKSEEYQKLPPL